MLFLLLAINFFWIDSLIIHWADLQIVRDVTSYCGEGGGGGGGGGGVRSSKMRWLFGYIPFVQNSLNEKGLIIMKMI